MAAVCASVVTAKSVKSNVTTVRLQLANGTAGTCVLLMTVEQWFTFASRAQLSLLGVTCRVVKAAGKAPADHVHCVAMRHKGIDLNLGRARSVTMHGSAVGAATRRSLRICLLAHHVPVARPCGVQLAARMQSWVQVFVAVASAKLKRVSIAIGMLRVQGLFGARAAWKIACGTFLRVMLAWSAPRTSLCLACYVGVAMVYA